MGCCGGRKQKRNPIPVSNPEPQQGEVLLTYTGVRAAPITIEGPVTGKGYQFSKFNRTKPVAEIDVPGLVGIGIFTL